MIFLQALWVLLVQGISSLLIPGLWMKLRDKARPLRLEDLWAALLLQLCFQAIAGSLWSLLLSSSPPRLELLLWALSGIAAAELQLRYAPAKRIQCRWTLTLLLLLALGVRLLPSLQVDYLGQSDAYSHLQFGQDLLAEGKLRNAIYPPGHPWVHIVPALLGLVQPFELYRFGGALPGTGMVLGLFLLLRRPCGERPALAAAFLAAGCPLLLPLIKTGVGVFANQFGLLLTPFALYCVLRRPFWLCALLPALALSVPVFLLDLLWPMAVLLLIHLKGMKRWTLVLPGLLGGALLLWRLLRLPAIHLQYTMRMLSGDPNLEALPEFVLHFLSPKSGPLPAAFQLPVLLIALSCALLPLWLKTLRRSSALGIVLLCALPGIQLATGLLQFGNYQRAGWLFLLGLAGASVLLVWPLILRLKLKRMAIPAAACSSVAILLFPPQHPPSLSGAEGELLRHLRMLQRQVPDPPIEIWVRPFNGFHNHQGDPVPALLERNPGYVLKQAHATEPIQFKPGPRGLLLLDLREPPQSADPLHSEQVRRLWQRNADLETQLLQQGPLNLRSIEQRGLKRYEWGIAEGD